MDCNYLSHDDNSHSHDHHHYDDDDDEDGDDQFHDIDYFCGNHSVVLCNYKYL